MKTCEVILEHTLKFVCNCSTLVVVLLDALSPERQKLRSLSHPSWLELEIRHLDINLVLPGLAVLLPPVQLH